MNAILVVKGKEPEVIKIKDGSYQEITDILKQYLSEDEKKLASFSGVESFCTGIDGILGYVEEFSALHPYERNRDWHGPALFIEYNTKGDTINMSDEHIVYLLDMFALKNATTSPSEYINNFLDTYGETITHNVSIGSRHGILNTMDAISYLKGINNPTEVNMIIDVFKHMEDVANKGEFNIKDILADYLKELNIFLFSKSLENDKFHDMF